MSVLEKLGIAAVALSIVLNVGAAYVFYAYIFLLLKIRKQPAFVIKKIAEVFPQYRGKAILVEDDNSTTIYTRTDGRHELFDDSEDSEADDDGPTMGDIA